MWDKSEVRIWRSGGEHLLVFGCRRASSAASAPARLGPGPCRQVSDCSSHEINSAWNLECSVATSSVFVRRKHPFDPIVTDQILAIISLDSLIRPQPPARRYCHHCLSPCLDRALSTSFLRLCAENTPKYRGRSALRCDPLNIN